MTPDPTGSVGAAVGAGAAAAFNQALDMAFDNRLGLCHVESERLVFPLTGRYARQFAAHRLALVGADCDCL